MSEAKHTKDKTARTGSGAVGACAVSRDESPEDVAARLDGIVSSLPGFAFQRRMDADGALSYTHFCGNLNGVLGYAPEAMAVNAQGCLHVVHWADRDGHLAAIRRSAQELSPCFEEFRAITQTGEVRWLKGASQPRRDGEAVVWDGALIDITEGRRAEFRLDMLMEHAADTILILDETGAIDAANAAAERLFGWNASELAGECFTVLLEGHHCHPDTMCGDLLDISGGLVGGGPRELVGLRKDGGTFPLEMSTAEVRMEGHRLFVSIGRDITARKATEAALRETEQRLGAIAANMPGMVFQRVLRSDGRLDFTYVSEGCRDFLGLEPEELMADAQLFMTALSTDERQRFLAALGRSARTMEPFEEEVAALGRDGRRRWLRGQSRPTRRDNGDIVWD
ncbi:MAG TPA: PAS domain S-box protein, partial [Magnetospirillum sp.]|nr:PAS domain S-box protein [Magnetospirillum sp.]